MTPCPCPCPCGTQALFQATPELHRYIECPACGNRTEAYYTEDDAEREWSA